MLPEPLWLLIICIVLALIGHYITEGLIRMLFFVLALVVAIVAVWRLIG